MHGESDDSAKNKRTPKIKTDSVHSSVSAIVEVRLAWSRLGRINRICSGCGEL